MGFIRKNLKWLILLLIIFFSYSFMFTVHCYFEFPQQPIGKILGQDTKIYHFAFTPEHAHLAGFFILAAFYDWPILVLAPMDEVLQMALPSRKGDLWDAFRNVIGALLGLFFRRYLIKNYSFKRKVKT